MLPEIVCLLVSPIPTKKGGVVPYLLFGDVETQIEIKCDIKARFHVVTFMLWRVCAFFKNVPNFWSNYNLDLRSYGQLLSLFSNKSSYFCNSLTHLKKVLGNNIFTIKHIVIKLNRGINQWFSTFIKFLIGQKKDLISKN